jgi:hypothetical protein
MLLFELFDEDGGMVDQLRGQVMDYLTPLAASGVEFTEMDDIAEVLRNARTGLIIDRGLIMRLIDPNVCKLVNKVEGEKVYLSLPVDEISAKTRDQEEMDKQKIEKTAVATAKKQVAKK